MLFWNPLPSFVEISSSSTTEPQNYYISDAQFWLDLMKEHAEKVTIKSKIGIRLSAHIAFFCRNHAAILSPEVFKRLTDEKYLLDDLIHPQAAVMLLDLSDRRIIGTNADERQQFELSPLQIRCVKAIARREDQAGFKSPEARKILTSLPQSVLYELIAALG
jgi:hypothetical protein